MQVTSLQLQNFRNFELQQIRFTPGVNILLGDNAQGKTNVIEALWLFAACKSFRVSEEKAFIRLGESRAAIYGEYERNGRVYRPVMKFYEDRPKEIFLNNGAIRPRDLVGQFPSVLFYPDHLSLIKGSPEGRRKFLDLAICQTDPAMLPLLNQYIKVQKQRNALLKKYNEVIDAKAALDVWDAKLAELSAVIALRRYAYIDRMTPYAKAVMKEISGGKEELEIEYKTVCPMPVQTQEYLEDQFFYTLKKNRQKDLILCHTTVGIHRDDFDVRINGADARVYASQGQQRSCVMALKMAEADLLREVTNESPVMLFDDVFSELDPLRKEYIIHRIRGRQVILSCCEPESDFKDAAVFQVSNGEIVAVGDS